MLLRVLYGMSVRAKLLKLYEVRSTKYYTASISDKGHCGLFDNLYPSIAQFYGSGCAAAGAVSYS